MVRNEGCVPMFPSPYHNNLTTIGTRDRFPLAHFNHLATPFLLLYNFTSPIPYPYLTSTTPLLQLYTLIPNPYLMSWN